jgi:hypothetical protein
VLFNTLSASTGEVNVAGAYLPLSRQAGGAAASAAVTATTGPLGASRLALTVTADSVSDATYRVLFDDDDPGERFLGPTRRGRHAPAGSTSAAATADRDTNLGGITPSGATDADALAGSDPVAFLGGGS